MSKLTPDRRVDRPRVTAFIKPYLTNSQAALVETDQGDFVIKAMNNRDGPNVLVAEWIATNAAAWLGVPVSPCAIVELSAVVDVRLDADGRKLAQPGPCFGSSFLRLSQGWDGDAETLKKVKNPEAIVGVVVADTWLRNLDRFCHAEDGTRRFENSGNLLLSSVDAPKGRFRLVAIDFGHAFGGPTTPFRRLREIGIVQDNTIYGCFPAFRHYMKRRALATFLGRLSRFTRGDAADWFKAIPSEWSLPAADADAIMDFMERRARFVVETLAKMICDDDGLWSEDPE